jgi:hypothetical protein
VLDDIVSILIVKKLLVTLSYLIQNFFLPRFITVFENTLENTATVRMAGQGNRVNQNIVNDEVDLLVKKRRLCFVSHTQGLFGSLAHDLYTFLYYMVAILIMNATENVVVKFH